MPEGLVVIADVPGVTPDHFDVRVDNHILTIRGQAAHGLPGELTYREYGLVHYFRQFELSAKVDESNITADSETRGLDAHPVQSSGSPAPQDCRGSQLTADALGKRHTTVPAQASRGLAKSMAQIVLKTGRHREVSIPNNLMAWIKTIIAQQRLEAQ